MKNSPVCPVLGIPLTPKNCDIDHDNPSFDELFSNFLNVINQTYETVELANPLTNDKDRRPQIKGDLLNQKWNNYHLKHANLRLLSKEAHQRRKKPKIG
ncbi:MAG: hypothetical protein WBG32_08475 [Nodosilinea sp.]